MPALSPTMEAGKILSWEVSIGDEVSEGDSLAQIETDKATLDFEVQEQGYVAKFLVDEGQGNVKVGSPLVVLVDNEDDVKAFENFSIDESTETQEDEVETQDD